MRLLFLAIFSSWDTFVIGQGFSHLLGQCPNFHRFLVLKASLTLVILRGIFSTSNIARERILALVILLDSNRRDWTLQYGVYLHSSMKIITLLWTNIKTKSLYIPWIVTCKTSLCKSILLSSSSLFLLSLWSSIVLSFSPSDSYLHSMWAHCLYSCVA